MSRFLLILSLTALSASGQEGIGPLPANLLPPGGLPDPKVLPEPLPTPIPEIKPLPDVFEDFPIEPIKPTQAAIKPPNDNPFVGILDKGTRKKTDTTLPANIQIKGDDISPKFENIDGQQSLRFNGRITLTASNGFQAFADDAIYNSTEKFVKLIGNVSIYQGGLLYRGESAVYHYETEKLDTRNLRLGLDPLLMEAGTFKKIEHEGRTVLVGEDSGITTHDVEKPDFWIRAERTTVFPGDRVIFKDFKLRIGDRNLFWLPYLSQPLDADLGYLAVPGGRSNLGVFVKNRYGVLLGGKRDPVTGENKDAWLLSQWHADFYSNRGLGLGLDLFDTRLDDKDQFGWLKLYYIYDFDPQQERAGVDRGRVDPNRYRVEFNHRKEIWESEAAKYTFDADLTLLSDQYYLEDFDPSLFRINRAPNNYLGVARRNANSLTTFGTQIRLNNFYQSTARLPELTHDWIRQPFLNSSVLYESQTSLGIYEEFLPSFQRDDLREEAGSLLAGDPRIDEIDGLLDDRGFARFHTYHEFSLPLKAGHLNIIPRVGAGHTNYQAVQGESSSTSRTHLSAGVDFSTKLTRAYPNISSQKWGLDGVRHIIEPYTSFNWLATDELDSSFQTIDRLSPTTRPNSRQVGRFTAIDDLQDWSVLRLGIRNRLVTRRNGGTHDWLNLDTYIDAFFEDPELNRNFSNLYNDLRWNPTPWFELDLETQFPVSSDANGNELAASFRFMPSDNFEFNIDYRHLNAHPILRDSDRIVLESFARLNEYWGIGTHHRFELEDDTLELQQYNLHYDFDSFVGSLGFFHRNNQDQDEYGVILSFGIKEIPSLSLPIEIGAE